MTGRKRGRWLMDFRRRHLLVEPCCRMCEQEQPPRYTVGTQVDHIVALTNGGRDFDVDALNAQTLCDAHHERKTAQDMGYMQRTECDTAGMPIDQAHHWNEE